MSSAFQNRLVGTIIIVALAVIFLPEFLDGKKQTTQDLFVSLPEQPVMQPVVEAPAFPTEEVKQATQQKVEVVPDVAVDDFDVDDNMQTETQPSQTPASQTDEVDTPVAEEGTPTPAIVEQSIDRPIEDPDEPTPNIESAPLKSGWVVQLGVFRHQRNVQELLGKLRNAGYQAFSRPVQTSSGELTKVFVGPDLNRDALEQALPDLTRLTKLQGRIAPFTVK